MIRVRDIISAPGLSDIMIIAGLNGQDREVRTVTVLDAPDGPKWLKGNELILSSAYLFENNAPLLMEYVTQLYEMNASGFCIKMGRFVNTIPTEVESFANKHNFPILKIPYKLVWTDIISVFYELQYKLWQPSHVIRYDPESVASLVEALKWNSHRLVERLTELFRLPLVLVDSSGSIQAENDMYGVSHVKSLLQSQGFFPENAVNETHEHGGLFISVQQVPALCTGTNEYLIFGVSTREGIQEMSRLFMLMERFLSVEGGSAQDEKQIYRHFLMRVMSGKITAGEIKSFEKNRAISGYVYSGIILLTGKNYQKIYEQIKEIAKHMRTGKNVPLSPHMLYDKSAGEALVLIEYNSGTPQPNIHSWIRGLIAEIEDSLILEGGGCISVSGMHPTLEEISVCLYEARAARKIGELLWQRHNKYSFNALSPYIMLLNADLSQVDFSDIKLLKSNEAFPSFDGAETIEAYIECNNYKLAAKRLYIHENTLRYRIQKINELLNLNLEDPFVSHNLLMKIKLWKLCNTATLNG